MIRTTRLGELTVRIVSELESGQRPELVVVLCHGFGAPGDDLVPVGVELLRQLPALGARVMFVFPEAPHELEELGYPGARAWWPLDAERLAAALEGQAPGDRRAECPEGLTVVRRALGRALDELGTGLGLAPDRVVIGGFSQGAMLATDLVLRAEERPAGLVVLSGTLICESDWRRLAPRRTDLPVFQSHGRLDPLLAFSEAEALRGLFDEAGLAADFMAFDGPHTITPEVLGRLVTWLAPLLEER